MTVFPQVGVVGLKLILVFTENGAPKDISPATGLAIVLRAPDGRSKQFAAAFKTNGEDGKVQYTTAAATDLDMAGMWEAQIQIVLGAFTGKSTRAFIPVRENADR